MTSETEQKQHTTVYTPRVFSPKNPPPFSSVGFFTYLRTYARRHHEDDANSTIESWQECITRVVNACETQLHVGFTDEEAQEVFDQLYNLKCSVAGRFLWQLGTRTVEESGLTSLQNCAFTVVNKPILPFTWTMNSLMCGSGVGFRVLPEDVEKLPMVRPATAKREDSKDADFIVPDSRAGWVKLLEKTLKARFYSGRSFTYSCLLLRSKGAPIKGFGGVASGPDALCEGISNINKVLDKYNGKKINSTGALDIMNIIGAIVVAGNVRRSAEISIGDCKDVEYLRAKRWDLGDVPNWRANSNNSVICNDIKDILDNEEFWNGYNGNGEPYGLINLKLHQECGRIGETQYSDTKVAGVNPCSEQSLEPYETCCLSELYLPHINSREILYRCAKNMYRICKHSLALPCPQSKETEEVVHRNMRMGIGITGYLQATEEQRSWLSDCYVMLREYDREYSKKHNWPVSKKLVTCKPSGTLSLLAGVSSGCHPAYSQYYIRRIRISSDSPLIKIVRDHGYHIEPVKRFDGTSDHTTSVIEFPYAFPDGTVCADKGFTAIDQLNVVKRLQKEWSDNAVSVTVTYKPEELSEIKEWLKENYNDNIKSVSFLLHSGHGFIQAPIEPITKEKYEELMLKTRPFISAEGICYKKEEDLIEGDCAGGSCPIK